MSRFTLSPAAESDIVSILAWTHEHYGERARLRYEALIAQAIIDVANDPVCPGSAGRNELSQDARTYHLGNSCDHVDPSVGRVGRPRHFLVYRSTGASRIEIGRILHDSMDLSSHLPPEYRAPTEDVDESDHE